MIVCSLSDMYGRNLEMRRDFVMSNDSCPLYNPLNEMLSLSCTVGAAQ